jgi:hypothetical protein
MAAAIGTSLSTPSQDWRVVLDIAYDRAHRVSIPLILLELLASQNSLVKIQLKCTGRKYGGRQCSALEYL